MTTIGSEKARSYSGDYMQDGRLAEEVCLRYLRGMAGVATVDDVRKVVAWQQRDVDFVVHLGNGLEASVEVKSDRHLGVSPNVIFEVLRINHTAEPDLACSMGWSARSGADWFVFYSPVRRAVYVCRAHELRRAFQRYTRKMRKQVRLNYVPTDAIKSTVNVLLPMDACEGVFTVHDVSSIVDDVLAGAVESM